MEININIVIALISKPLVNLIKEYIFKKIMNKPGNPRNLKFN